MAYNGAFTPLCSICNRFRGVWPIPSRFSHPDFRSVARDHHAEFGWDAIIASAKSCYCCNILVEGLRGCFKWHAKQESEIRTIHLRFNYPWSPEDIRRTRTEKSISIDMGDDKRFDVNLFSPEDAPRAVPANWGYFPALRRRSPRPDSTKVPEVVKGWLDKCAKEHTSTFCREPTPADMPTRVIHVGRDNNDVRLMECPDGTKDYYACLSHCWGALSILTTTKATLEERKRGIIWEHLPQTFQDAIIFTRALKIRYLWIDSLCIVQNDTSDWEKEAAQMASIYANGMLTLAATRSADGNGGLFFDAHDFDVCGVSPHNEPYHLCFRKRIEHQIGAEMEATRRLHPLFDRAWVYQERMLSTRVLHFGQYELFWECKSVLQCDCGDIEQHARSVNSDVPLVKVSYTNAIERFTPMAIEEIGPDQLYQLARLWRTMVSAYTDLLLSEPGDRLPALSGLARQMATARKSKYLAGVWDDSLSVDILWEGCGWPRPEPRTAPTWSWASVDKFIGFYDYIFVDYRPENSNQRSLYRHYATIENCIVTPLGLDEFGHVARGVLTVSGLFVTGWLETGLDIYEMCLPTGKWSFKQDYDLRQDGTNRVDAMSSIHCLRMSVAEIARVVQGRMTRTQGLYSLVLRSSPEHPGFYERIGILEITEDGPTVDAVGDLYRTAEERTVSII